LIYKNVAIALNILSMS